MNTYLIPVGADGPVLAVELTLPHANLQALRTAGAPLPAPVTVPVLFDTGADVSVLDPAVLAPLVTAGLRPTRFSFAGEPSGGGPAPEAAYLVGLTLPPVAGQARSGLVLRSHPVFERAFGTLGYRGLLGRDVLRRCVLLYDGPGRRAILAV